jgi:acetyl-CoA carboxylase biotin carboxyl carrier protein
MSDDQKPPLSFEDVQEILRILEKSTFDELRLNVGGLRLHLRRGAEQSSAPAWEDAEPAKSVAAAPPAKGETNIRRVLPGAAASGLIEIRAPILGTFYRAPRPGAPPFVDVGTKLNADTVVGIIEIMKLMNAVPAGVGGEVCEICVENGQAVEYDQVLMRVLPTR